jgi:hypothetical protein
MDVLIDLTDLLQGHNILDGEPRFTKPGAKESVALTTLYFFLTMNLSDAYCSEIHQGGKR